MVLVSDSWMIRYAARSTAAGSGTGSPVTVSAVSRPARRAPAMRSSSWAVPGAGWVGSASSAWRSTFRMARSSLSPSLLAVLIACRDSAAASGRVGSTWAATPACTLMVAMV